MPVFVKRVHADAEQIVGPSGGDAGRRRGRIAEPGRGAYLAFKQPFEGMPTWPIRQRLF